MATLSDYLHEVEHAGNRIERLERAIDTAVESVPEKMRAVIEALQALRGIAQISAVSLVLELGELSRFARPKQLMGYSGAVASEHSSGERVRRYGITKTNHCCWSEAGSGWAGTRKGGSSWSTLCHLCWSEHSTLGQ